MCGRYTLTIDKSTIEKRFGAKYYIAVAAQDECCRRGRFLRPGLGAPSDGGQQFRLMTSTRTD